MKLLLLALALAACGASPAPVAAPPPVTNRAPPLLPPQRTDIDSTEILAREAVTESSLVRHVLIGWAELAPNYRTPFDPRAAARSQKDAARIAEKIAAKLRGNLGLLDVLVKEYSEDPGSHGEPYEVTPDKTFVPELKQLALRLQIGEVGIVTTSYGYHVVVRVTPPPPDPLESADILARTTVADEVEVQHILIGWEGLDKARDAMGKSRTKAEADALATDLLAQIRAGADIVALMKQHSEDPSADAGRTIPVADNSNIVEPFKRLALRLNVDEIGLVKSAYGWHIVKRVPPPPLDPLESAVILGRTTTAERVKVKHILLGWTEAHAEDPRGIKRTRAQLDKLVKATLKKLAKPDANINAMMAELSEDPGSAKTGEPYEVMPSSPMVKPFLKLSLRLALNEVGVVRTVYGMHIVKRVE